MGFHPAQISPGVICMKEGPSSECARSQRREAPHKVGRKRETSNLFPGGGHPTAGGGM